MTALARSVRGVTHGRAARLFFERLDPDVARLVEEAIGLLQPKVREIRDVTLPRFQFVKDGSYNVELYHYQKPFFDKSPELYHPWSRRQLEGLKSVSAVGYVETLEAAAGMPARHPSCV